MKKIVVFLLVAITLLTASTVGSIGVNSEIFDDVCENDWYYTSVEQLYNNKIIPASKNFYGDSAATRGDVILYMYNLYIRLGGQEPKASTSPFKDITKNSKYLKAVIWATENNIANGETADEFNPNGQCLREQACVMAIRYFNAFGIKPQRISEPVQFADSLSISDYARSYVVSAKMSGISSGNENGYFLPHDAITRAETAAVVYTMMNISVSKPSEDFVETTDGVYAYLYNEYKTEDEFNFKALVPESSPVETSYFDDAAIVGDSVSLSLQYYCASTSALGKATFLCAGSLSPTNSLWDVSSTSIHPIYNGQKMKIEDAIALSGANKVYIMLGINNLSTGVDNNLSDLNKLVSRILAKSPNAKIIMQSVTPMTATSSIIKPTLNNGIINEYNAKLLELCQKNMWYYLNVAEQFKNSEGNLIQSYCSDAYSMGIHFTFDADKLWVDYLKTHVPQALR